MLPLLPLLLASGGPAPPPTEVADLVTPLVVNDVLHGVVVGWIDADGERTVRGFGRRSRTDDRAPSADSLFEIGSVTKVFTGLLLATAVDAGELALDDPLERLLPEEHPPPKLVPPIRVVHLATHTSGLPEIPPDLERDVSRFVVDYAGYDEPHLLGFVEKLSPLTTPGTAFQYSNAGVGLLGWALGGGSAAGYAERLARTITEPLGLDDTAVDVPEDSRARLVPGHDPNGDEVPRMRFGSLVGCGGLVSSANDLLDLLAAFLDPEHPFAPAMELAATPHHRQPDGSAVGLGWFVARDGVTRFHDGQTAGYTAFVSFDPVRRTAVCVLANVSSVRVSELGLAVLQRLVGLDVTPPVVRTVAAVDGAALEPLVGRYASPFGIAIDVSRTDDRLYAHIAGQPRWRLYPESDSRFYYRGVEAAITFEREEDGPARRLVLHQNGRDLPFTRKGD